MAKSQIQYDLLIFCTRYASMSEYCSKNWPRGGLSSSPMVPTTTNLTAPATPHQDLFTKWQDVLQQDLVKSRFSEIW